MRGSVRPFKRRSITLFLKRCYEASYVVYATLFISDFTHCVPFEAFHSSFCLMGHKLDENGCLTKECLDPCEVSAHLLDSFYNSNLNSSLTYIARSFYTPETKLCHFGGNF